jgi:hypothetical protein
MFLDYPEGPVLYQICRLLNELCSGLKETHPLIVGYPSLSFPSDQSAAIARQHSRVAGH